MNLSLHLLGASLFTLIHAAGQGPRNPRALREPGNVAKKDPAYGNADWFVVQSQQMPPKVK